MFNIEYSHQFPDDKVEDLLVCALEGGSNYWYVIEEVLPAYNIIVDGGELDVYTAVMHGAGVRVGLLEPGETVNGQSSWILNRAALHHGLQLVANLQPTTFARIVTEDYDSNDADMVLQFALFHDVVFG
jgi:hypothetical protein